MKLIMALCVAGLAYTCAASPSGWLRIVEGVDGSKLDGLAGSLKIIPGYSSNLAELVVRRTPKKGDVVNLEKWRVPLSGCEAKMGAIYIAKIDGTILSESEFVFGGGNIASIIAETICKAATQISP